MKSLVFV